MYLSFALVLSVLPESLASLSNSWRHLFQNEMEYFEDLLLKMLAYNPEERISVAEALGHP